MKTIVIILVCYMLVCFIGNILMQLHAERKLKKLNKKERAELESRLQRFIEEMKKKK